jgi:hypothetical protein
MWLISLLTLMALIGLIGMGLVVLADMNTQDEP